MIRFQHAVTEKSVPRAKQQQSVVALLFLLGCYARVSLQFICKLRH